MNINPVCRRYHHPHHHRFPGSRRRESSLFRTLTVFLLLAGLAVTNVIGQSGGRQQPPPQYHPGAPITIVCGGAERDEESSPIVTGAATIQSRATTKSSTGSPEFTIRPQAVFRDELHTTPVRLEARNLNLPAGAVVSIFFFTDHLNHRPESREVELHDSGLHGDAVAGDATFGIELRFDAVPSATAPLQFYDYQLSVQRFALRVRDRTGTILPNYNRHISFGIVNRPAEDAAPIVHRFGSRLWATNHVANVVLDELAADSYTEAARHEFESAHPTGRDFDFLAVFAAGETIGDGTPRTTLYRNEVGGIGLPLFGDGSQRLQAVISMNQDQTGAGFLHEIGHRWGVYLNQPHQNLTYPLSRAQPAGVHWSVSSSASGGELRAGGGSLRPLDSGTFQFTDTGEDATRGRGYDDLELYLMGLIPAAEVAPRRVLRNRLSVLTLTPFALVSESETELIGISDIQASYGARTPDWQTAQKTFRTAFIVASRARLTDAEMAVYEVLARHYASASPGAGVVTAPSGFMRGRDYPSFAFATGGRGVLATQLASTVEVVPPRSAPKRRTSVRRQRSRR